MTAKDFEIIHYLTTKWLKSATFVKDKLTEKSIFMQNYTSSQLALRNGQDYDEIWVAMAGKIYDVTDSKMWKDGKHYEHWAGQDLTEELKDAPHTATVFEKFKIVGILVG